MEKFWRSSARVELRLGCGSPMRGMGARWRAPALHPRCTRAIHCRGEEADAPTQQQCLLLQVAAGGMLGLLACGTRLRGSKHTGQLSSATPTSSAPRSPPPSHRSCELEHNPPPATSAESRQHTLGWWAAQGHREGKCRSQPYNRATGCTETAHGRREVAVAAASKLDRRRRWGAADGEEAKRLGKRGAQQVGWTRPKTRNVRRMGRRAALGSSSSRPRLPR